MARNRLVDIMILILLVIGLFAGTYHLMAMRFRSGDIYPPYSSLRTDPLGCKALYDALEHVNSAGVRRHYTSIEDIDPGPGGTVLILGLGVAGLGVLGKDLERIAAGGSRVVVALRVRGRRHREPRRENDEESPPGDSPPETDPAEGPEAGDKNGQLWNLDMNVSSAPADSSGKYQAALVPGSADLPGWITVTSPVYFDAASDKWREIYTFEDGPVMLHGAIGQGSVVLLSDSYPVSNEALRWELYPRLLSWLLSGTGDVVFLETHLGVREKRGVMTLVRKYRLITLLSCISVVALLAVWKNAIPLVAVPDPADPDNRHTISEKDQFTGLVSLLKRNIGPGSVIQLCLREFRKGPRGRSRGRGDLDRALREVSGHDDLGKDPVKAYNRITKKLSERIKG